MERPPLTNRVESAVDHLSKEDSEVNAVEGVTRTAGAQLGTGNEEFIKLCEEIRQGDDETMKSVLALHHEVVERLTALGELMRRAQGRGEPS